MINFKFILTSCFAKYLSVNSFSIIISWLSFEAGNNSLNLDKNDVFSSHVGLELLLLHCSNSSNVPIIKA